MALKKLITNENGISCDYHRIAVASLNADTKTAEVLVRSYISKDIRGVEKQTNEKQLRRIVLDGQIRDLVEKNNANEWPYEDRIELAELQRELDELVADCPEAESPELVARSVWQKTYIVDFETTDETSYTTFYQALKTLEDFSGAEDC